LVVLVAVEAHTRQTELTLASPVTKGTLARPMQQPLLLLLHLKVARSVQRVSSALRDLTQLSHAQLANLTSRKEGETRMIASLVQQTRLTSLWVALSATSAKALLLVWEIRLHASAKD
jgi:hypothetical protein